VLCEQLVLVCGLLVEVCRLVLVEVCKPVLVEVVYELVLGVVRRVWHQCFVPVIT